MPTNNLYEDLAKIKNELDLSNYPQHHALYDTSRRMTPGYFKDESDGFDVGHMEFFVDDFSIEVLLPNKMSQLGPFISKGG